MQTISVDDAALQLSALIEQVAAGEEIVIAEAGKPIARLLPMDEAQQTRRVLGLGLGKLRVPDHFDSLHADAIQAMFEGDSGK